MPIDSFHPQLTQAREAIRLVRDCIEGGPAVRRGGEIYLPALYKQGPDKYLAMQRRAVFFNATGRTLEAFEGFIFRRNPEFTVPDSMGDFMNDATMTGQAFYDYCKDVVSEVLSVKRTGTLVDWDENENRAFVKRYDTEDIINWQYSRIRGHMELTMLVLREHSLDPMQGSVDTAATTVDPYDQEIYEQWRLYELIGNVDAGTLQVKVSLWRRDESEGRSSEQNFVQVGPAMFPSRRGTYLDEIPFRFHNIKTADEADPTKIPMEPIASVNISHYQTSADLEQGRHACGVPTPYAIGFGDEMQFTLGPDNVWTTDNPAAKVGFLEYSGASLGALQTALEEKQSQMAALGARMLEKQQVGRGNVEAYETVQVRQSGETSALLNATIACTQSLSRVLRLVAWWSGIGDAEPEDLTEEVFMELNTDFISQKLDAPTLTALWAGYLQNAISYEVLFWNLQQGDIIPSDRKIEDEEKALGEAKAAADKVAQDKAAAAAKASAQATATGDVVPAAKGGKQPNEGGEPPSGTAI
jgi:hypothetical protein